MSSFHLLVLETAFQDQFRDGLPAPLKGYRVVIDVDKKKASAVLV